MNNLSQSLTPFNLVIVGTGGQGLITLLDILSSAAIKQGFDVKTSELHGLSQRGGSVEVHLKFGSEVFFSPNWRSASKSYCGIRNAGMP